MKIPYKSLFNRLQDTIWAMHPAKLQEINLFLEGVFNGRHEFEAAAGKQGNKTVEEPYQTVDGVAVIPVMGTLAKKANLLTDYSGGTSYELLGKQFQAALADPNVASIMLEIDSPGGTADGVKTLADQIYQARGQKPIVAYSDGLMASAAYWVASAADKIISSDTAIVGSIGVAGTHYDRSGQDEQRGVKRTVISSGKYKRIASDAEPLTAEGREYLQQLSDTFYAIFVDSVARNRGESTETVQADMAEGREFIGRQALTAGLVDDIGTINNALQLARKMGKKKTGGYRMDLSTLKTQHPDVYQEILEIGAKDGEAKGHLDGHSEGYLAGVGTERQRVLKILTANGDREITMAAVADGTDTETALSLFLEAEKSFKAEALANMQSAAPESVGQNAGGPVPEQITESDLAVMEAMGITDVEKYLASKRELAKRGV